MHACPVHFASYINAGQTRDSQFGGEGSVAQCPVPFAGSIVAIAGLMAPAPSALPVSGSIAVQATVNGTPVGPVVNLTPSLQSELELIPAGDAPLSFGDGVGIRYVASADLETSDLDSNGNPSTLVHVVAVAWVAFT